MISSFIRVDQFFDFIDYILDYIFKLWGFGINIEEDKAALLSLSPSLDGGRGINIPSFYEGADRWECRWDIFKGMSKSCCVILNGIIDIIPKE